MSRVVRIFFASALLAWMFAGVASPQAPVSVRVDQLLELDTYGVDQEGNPLPDGVQLGETEVRVTPPSAEARDVLEVSLGAVLQPTALPTMSFGLRNLLEPRTPGEYRLWARSSSLTPLADGTLATSWSGWSLPLLVLLQAAPVPEPVAGQTLWPATAVPAFVDSADATPYELGVRFRAARAGRVKALRFYKASANGGAHTVSLWRLDGTRLATAAVTAETPSGWQEQSLAEAVPIEAATIYVASYWAPVGRYSYSPNVFAQPVLSGDLEAVAAAVSPNGCYHKGASAFPATASGGLHSYWVDLVFEPGTAPPQPPPEPPPAPPPKAGFVRYTHSGLDINGQPVVLTQGELKVVGASQSSSATALATVVTASGSPPKPNQVNELPIPASQLAPGVYSGWLRVRSSAGWGGYFGPVPFRLPLEEPQPEQPPLKPSTPARATGVVLEVR